MAEDEKKAGEMSDEGVSSVSQRAFEKKV